MGMSRAAARTMATIVAVVLLLIVRAASAADKIDKFVSQLESSDDFRVRTQAALALGASKNKKAVDPLCKALDDASTAVRAASAAALGKLKLGGGKCLESRLAEESNASVKASIKKAIALVSAGDEPAITSKTKYYVAIGKTADKTGRDAGEVDKIVRSAIASTADSMDGYVVAPADETSAQATKRITKFKQLKAYYLSPKIGAPTYAGNKLTVKCEVAIFTYPGKALKGMFTVKRSMADVSSGDTQAENELIKAAAEGALETFSKAAERLE
jgi:HEAT repeats